MSGVTAKPGEEAARASSRALGASAEGCGWFKKLPKKPETPGMSAVGPGRRTPRPKLHRESRLLGELSKASLAAGGFLSANLP